MVEIFITNQAEVDSSTLAALSAVSLGDLLGTVVRNFMCKNLRSQYHVSIPNIGDSFVIVLCSADASTAEIAAALTSTTKNLEDTEAYRTAQVTVRRVWDIQSINYEGLAAGGSVQQQIDWKLPPKGIPVLKGGGLKVVVFNTDTIVAFGNGPTFKAIHKMMGGWF